MAKRAALVLAIGAWAASASVLGTGNPAMPRNIAPPTRIPDPVAPQTPGERVDIAAVPRGVRRAVVADAARRFSVTEKEVVLVNAERVTWSDGSLDCPASGRMYSQAQVPGYRIAAKTSAGQMLYHTDSLDTVVTCGIHPGAEVHPADKVVKPVEPRAEPPPSRTTPDR